MCASLPSSLAFHQSSISVAVLRIMASLARLSGYETDPIPLLEIDCAALLGFRDMEWTWIGVKERRGAPSQHVQRRARRVRRSSPLPQSLSTPFARCHTHAHKPGRDALKAFNIETAQVPAPGGNRLWIAPIDDWSDALKSGLDTSSLFRLSTRHQELFIATHADRGLHVPESVSRFLGNYRRVDV